MIEFKRCLRCALWLCCFILAIGSELVYSTELNSPTLLSNLGVHSANAPISRILISVDNADHLIFPAYENESFNPNQGGGLYGLFKADADYVYSRSRGRFEEINRSEQDTVPFSFWSGKFLNWLTARRIDLVQQLLIGESIPVEGHAISNRSEFYIVKRAEKSKDFSPITNHAPIKVHVDHFYFNGLRYQINIGEPARKRPLIDSEYTSRGLSLVDLNGEIQGDKFKVFQLVRNMKEQVFDRHLKLNKTPLPPIVLSSLLDVFSYNDSVNIDSLCERTLVLEFATSSQPSSLSSVISDLQGRDCIVDKSGLQRLDYLAIKLTDELLENDYKYSMPIIDVSQFDALGQWIRYYDNMHLLYQARINLETVLIPNESVASAYQKKNNVMIQAFSGISFEQSRRVVKEPKVYGELVAFWIDEDGRYRSDNGDFVLGSSQEDQYIDYCFDQVNLKMRFVISEYLDVIDQATASTECRQTIYPYSIDDVEFLWRHKDDTSNGFSRSKLTITPSQQLVIANNSGHLIRYNLDLVLSEDPNSRSSDYIWRFEPEGEVLSYGQPYIVNVASAYEVVSERDLNDIGDYFNRKEWRPLLIFPVFEQGDKFVSQSVKAEGDVSLNVHIFDIANTDSPLIPMQSIELKHPVSRQIIPQLISLPRTKNQNVNISDNRLVLCLFEGEEDSLLVKVYEAQTVSPRIRCFDIENGQPYGGIDGQKIGGLRSFVSGVSAFDGDKDGLTDSIFAIVNEGKGQGSAVYRLSVNQTTQGRSNLFDFQKVFESESQSLGRPLLIDVSENELGLVFSQVGQQPRDAVVGLLIDWKSKVSNRIKSEDLATITAKTDLSKLELAQDQGWIFELNMNDRISDSVKYISGNMIVPIVEERHLDECRTVREGAILRISDVFKLIKGEDFYKGVIGTGLNNGRLNGGGLGSHKLMTKALDDFPKKSALNLDRFETEIEALTSRVSNDQIMILQPLSWTLL